MRLGDAYRERAEPGPLVGVELPGGPRGVAHASRAVDPPGHGLDLLPQARLVGVQEAEPAGLVGGLGHRLGQLGGAAAAVGEVGAHRGPGSHIVGDRADRVVLAAMVGGEGVDRDYRRDAVQGDVLELLAQVRGTGQHVVGVLLQQVGRQRLARDHLVLA